MYDFEEFHRLENDCVIGTTCHMQIYREMWYSIAPKDYLNLLYHHAYMLYLMSAIWPILYLVLPTAIFYGGNTGNDIWDWCIMHMTLFAAPFSNFLGDYLSTRVAAAIVLSTI